jgi:hypothetical protein
VKLLRLLSTRERLSLAPRKLALRDGVRVAVDGFDVRRRVLCEAYAHVGKTHGSQPGKVAKDILKFVTFEKARGLKYRKILCFADKAAASCVLGKRWLAEAARLFKVEVITLNLPAKTRSILRAAQRRQVMVNR